MPENPGLAVKLYHWMRTVSETGLTTFETFVGCMEVLIKNSFEYHIDHYRNARFDKFEVFLAISLGHYKAEREDILLTSISYNQVLTFFKELFNMFNAGIADEHSNSIVPKLLATSVFRYGQNSICWRDFVLFIRLNFPYIDNIIRAYFTNRFINKSVPIHLPVVSETPSVLNTELLSLFCLTNSSFQNLPQLHLVYSTAKYGKNFNNLAASLKTYDGPTLLLIKHSEVTGGNTPRSRANKNTYVCGGFTKAPWKDGQHQTGSWETVVFSLTPRFRLCTPRPDGNQNFAFLNTKHGSKIGLGFGGGSNDGNYKLWIDENITSGSYTNEDDGTFAKGALVEPSVTKLNIEQIEVWGLSGESNFLKRFRRAEGDENKIIRKTAPPLRSSPGKDSFVESKIMPEEPHQQKGFLLERTFSMQNYGSNQQRQNSVLLKQSTQTYAPLYERVSSVQK